MKAPSTRGLGQGLAQVVTTGRAANAVIQQEQAKAAAEAAKRKKEEEALKELRGQYDDIMKSKLWYTRDGETFRQMTSQLFDYTRKNGSKLLDVTSPEYQNYMDMKMQISDFANKSAEAKAHAEQIDKSIFGAENYDNYNDEQRLDFMNWSATPGNFDMPRYAADFKIDLEKDFNSKVFDPLKADAELNKKAGSGFDKTKGVATNYSVLQSDPKVAENLFNQWIADPKVLSTIESRFAKDAKEKGMSAVDYYKQSKQDQLNFKATVYGSKPLSDSGKSREFNAGNIVEGLKFNEGTPVFRTAWTTDWAKTPAMTGTSYQTEGVKASVPGTVNIKDNNGRTVTTSENMVEGDYAYPTLMYYTGNTQDGSYKIVPKGTKGAKADVFVFGDVLTDEVDASGNNLKKTVIRPFYEVKEAFAANGYPVDEIEQALKAKSAAATKTKNTGGAY